MTATRALCAMLAAAALVSCGGDGGESATTPPPPTPPIAPPPIDVAVSGMAVIKVQAGDAGITMMEERLTALTEQGPDRSLAMLDALGASTGHFAAPAGFALIDFAQHPSGEISVALATATSVRLARLDRAGAVLGESEIVDPQAATDPFFDTGGVRDDRSLLPVFTRDAVRIAAIGEDLAVALRTGRNATVAYRFRHAGPAGYTRAWRTLVEPGLSVFAIGITSGTFDTFGALLDHWQVRLDADSAGNIAVGVVSRDFACALFAAHAAYFGTPIGAQEGVLVTRLAPDGTRLDTAVIDTAQVAELHALRVSTDGVAIAGRVFSERRADGGGWNAYTAHVGADGVRYRTLDVDLGEILFDIAPLGDGRHLVAGAAGYTQNPDGASVSEQAAPLVAVLEPDGSLRSRIALAAGARQNQARAFAPRGGRWLVGGMTNGPGTHSGDADRSRITADGFLREIAIP